jgi:excisionase family DNA binding protein
MARDAHIVAAASTGVCFESLLTSREAAPYLRIHYKTLEAKARLGLVPAVKHGKEWLFRLSLLDQQVDKELKSNLTNHAALTPNRKDQEP